MTVNFGLFSPVHHATQSIQFAAIELYVGPSCDRLQSVTYFPAELLLEVGGARLATLKTKIPHSMMAFDVGARYDVSFRPVSGGRRLCFEECWVMDLEGDLQTMSTTVRFTAPGRVFWEECGNQTPAKYEDLWGVVGTPRNIPAVPSRPEIVEKPSRKFRMGNR